MPIHFISADFQQNFPAALDVFPTAQDLQNYLDAIFLNRIAETIAAIESFLITYKDNIEAPIKDSFTGGNGQISFAVPVGRYPVGRTATAQDTSLVAANILLDITIFGVTGSYAAVPVSWVGDRDRSDAIGNTLTVGLTDRV